MFVENFKLVMVQLSGNYQLSTNCVSDNDEFRRNTSGRLLKIRNTYNDKKSINSYKSYFINKLLLFQCIGVLLSMSPKIATVIYHISDEIFNSLWIQFSLPFNNRYQIAIYFSDRDTIFIFFEKNRQKNVIYQYFQERDTMFLQKQI